MTLAASTFPLVAHATLSESIKSRWSRFCHEYLIGPDYRETLKTNIVQNLSANAANEYERLNRLLNKYQLLGEQRILAARILGQGGDDLVLTAEDSAIYGIEMTEIGHELRKALNGDGRWRKHRLSGSIRKALDQYRRFESRWVIVQNAQSGEYMTMDVEDF